MLVKFSDLDEVSSKLSLFVVSTMKKTLTATVKKRTRKRRNFPILKTAFRFDDQPQYHLVDKINITLSDCDVLCTTVKISYKELGCDEHLVVTNARFNEHSDITSTVKTNSVIASIRL
jgi:hypothetical protein